MNDFAVDLLQFFFSAREKTEKKMDVCVVGLDGVFCKASLGDEVVKKELFGSSKLLWEGFSGDGRLWWEKRKRPLQVLQRAQVKQCFSALSRV